MSTIKAEQKKERIVYDFLHKRLRKKRETKIKNESHTSLTFIDLLTALSLITQVPQFYMFVVLNLINIPVVN